VAGVVPLLAFVNDPVTEVAVIISDQTGSIDRRLQQRAAR
jgi:hypothetical protein